MTPKTVTLVLDEALERRFQRYCIEAGLDEASALDLALRAFLDAEDKAWAARDAVLAAAREGEDGAAFALDHADIRRWLLSWGSELEVKRPRSC